MSCDQCPTTIVIFAIMMTVALNGCSGSRTTFTPFAFETAKAACGAADAYILQSDPKAVGFKGLSPAHAEQAKCLIEQLKGTGVKMIGFISEPPS